MKTETLKVKDWLKERRLKPQFQFMAEKCVKRISDGKIVRVVDLGYSSVHGYLTIKAFYTNRIHIDVRVQNTMSIVKMEINDLR